MKKEALRRREGEGKRARGREAGREEGEAGREDAKEDARENVRQGGRGGGTSWRCEAGGRQRSQRRSRAHSLRSAHEGCQHSAPHASLRTVRAKPAECVSTWHCNAEMRSTQRASGLCQHRASGARQRQGACHNRYKGCVPADVWTMSR
eukprot:837043-Rhodomonas_salina.1